MSILGTTNFQRKKSEMIYKNMWKSNFISLWEKFGTTVMIDGVECLDYYKIDGDGEGQKRMSKHLQQPELWQETSDDSLEYVHLTFSFDKYVVIYPWTIDEWLAGYKGEVANHDFDRLKYDVVDGRITHSRFYVKDDPIPVDPPTEPPTYEPDTYTVSDDPFLNHLAFLLAARARRDSQNVSYDADITLSELEDLMDAMAAYTVDPQNGEEITFYLPLIEKEVKGYALEEGVGTNILDDLVYREALFQHMNSYYLPLDALKKMGGATFIEILSVALDFDYKEDTDLWDVLLGLLGFIVGIVAAVFGYPQLAMMLFISTISGRTDNKVLKIISAVAAFYVGDVTSLANLTAGEALSLLLNVYGLYLELKFTPETQKDTVPEEDNTPYLLYEAPYDAYDALYDFDALLSVEPDGVY